MPDVIQIPDPRIEMPRTMNQRWFRWRNVSNYACPPFGFFTLRGLEEVGDDDTMEVVFSGAPLEGQEPSQLVNSSDVGVPWNAAFNSAEAVEPMEYGMFTVDLPTWCLTKDLGYDAELATEITAGLLGFATYYPGRQRWSLCGMEPREAPSDLNINSAFWTGFRVIATMRIPEMTAIWQQKQPDFLYTHFRVGFITGLVTHLYGSQN